MGIFGNIGETLSNFKHAFKGLIYKPLQDEIIFFGIAKGSAFFVKESLYAITGSVGSIFSSLKYGVQYMVRN